MKSSPQPSAELPNLDSAKDQSYGIEHQFLLKKRKMQKADDHEGSLEWNGMR